METKFNIDDEALLYFHGDYTPDKYLLCLITKIEINIQKYKSKGKIVEKVDTKYIVKLKDGSKNVVEAYEFELYPKEQFKQLSK